MIRPAPLRPVDSRLRVLLVEDDAGDALLTMERLERTPGGAFDVWHEPALGAARRRIGEARPDVVLLDLDLPDCQGLASLQGLRSALPDVPVIVLTGNDDDLLGAAALQEGAEDFLAKSRVDATALRRACLWAVERRRHDELARRALDVAPVALVVVDDDGRVLTANRAAARLLETTPDGLVGERLDLVPLDGAVTDLVVDVSSRHPVRLETHTAAFPADSPGRWMVRLEPRRASPAQPAPAGRSDNQRAFEAFASTAADHVNQDLTTLLAHLDRLVAATPDAATRERVVSVLEVVDRLTAFAQRMAILGEPPRALTTRVELGALLDDLVIAARESADRDVTISLDVPPNLAAVAVDPLHLCSAFLDLVAGAVRRQPEGGTVGVSARGVFSGRRGTAASARSVRITIADDGASLGDDVFEGDLTHPVLRRGRDLRLDVQLAFAACLVRAAGGSIRCFSASGFGTRVGIYLPTWESR